MEPIRESLENIQRQVREYRISESNGEEQRCKVCDGTGWEDVRMPKEFVEEIYGEADLPECYYMAVVPCTACAQKQKVSRAREISTPSLNVTMRDFDWSLYGAEGGTKREYIDNYLSNFLALEDRQLGGLYIWSRTYGTGKTLLARCICGELIRRYGVSCVFVTAAELVERSKDHTDGGGDPLGVYTGCRMLVIDDLGQKVTAREWMNDVLYRVIDHRYRDRRAVIITSNYPPDQIAGKADGRIVDRINDMTMPVALPEVPIRRNMSEQRKSAILTEINGGNHERS